MVNIAETFIGLTIASALVTLIAWVQSRGGGDRAARYGARMRRFARITLVVGVIAAALETYIRVR